MTQILRWFSTARSSAGDTARRSAQRRRIHVSFESLARELQELPDGPERTVGYQRLAEAKQWFLLAVEEEG
ncbi:MAG: hypothetical protein OXG44_01530 [Gammaproteobacteria bacterium]|nr:hypothetical protein [Gammaproteobacteria bacterium]